MTGKIKKIVVDKGYGFIKGDDNKDYFFHYTGLVEHSFEALSEGTKVSYEVTVKDGKLRANVIIVFE